MMIRYRRIILGGVIFFLFFILLDWIIFPNRAPRIESAQTEFLVEHIVGSRSETSRRGAAVVENDPLEEDQLLPVGNQVWQWLPRGQHQNQYTDLPEIAAMKKTLSTLNTNMTKQDNRRLISILRKYWLRPPSSKSYNLEEPTVKDFSKGQSAIVDGILDQKEHGFFVECGALDGETRSNTLFFERERGWTGLLIEAGPLNYRKLIKKNRRAYSTPACLGVHPYPTKMYFHRGKNRGRLIDGKEALEWVRRQSMNVWLMEVQCFPLFSLLLAVNRTQIDYFSLDIEGVEIEVLQTIPWNKVDIDVLTVEFAHDKGGKNAILNFMADRGYEAITEITRMDGLANDIVFKKQSQDRVPFME